MERLLFNMLQNELTHRSQKGPQTELQAEKSSTKIAIENCSEL
jgi:hypothetical protein